MKQPLEEDFEVHQRASEAKDLIPRGLPRSFGSDST